MKSTFNNTEHNRTQRRKSRVKTKTDSFCTGNFNRVKNKYWLWGKYAGTLLKDMDTGYLIWTRANSSPQMSVIADREIKRRAKESK